MRLTISAGAVADAAKLATEALDPKVVIPALQAARLCAEGGVLRLSVNTLDQAVAVTVPAAIETDGECAPAALPFAKLVAGFPAAAPITLAATDQSLAVQSGRARYKLPTLPLADLPSMPNLTEGDGTIALELTLDQAARALQRPQFAITHEEARYYLGGILVQTAGDAGIRSVATDGHRLAVVTSAAALLRGEADAEGPGIIVPRQAVALVLKLLRARKPATVVLRRSKTLVQVTADGFSLTSKLIDAVYPDYARLIPGAGPNQATVDRAELVEALARLAAVVDRARERKDKALLGVVGLEWAAGDSAIKLTLSRQPDAGTDLIDAELTGSARIAFNVNLLIEQLEELEGEGAHFDISSNGPVLITDPSDGKLLTLLMMCRW